jgi:hypothetical protein
MAGDREACLTVGMNDYLSNPLSASQFLSMIAQWLHWRAVSGTLQVPSALRSSFCDENGRKEI